MPSEFIKRQKDDLFRDITSLGSLFTYLLITIFLLIQKSYQLFSKLAIGLIIIYIITITIRSFYFKDRPKKYPHSSFIERLDASSFPSLHSERIAFLSALFITYFNNMIVSVFLILLTIGVSYSRVYLKKHDKIDVLAGIIFGVVIYFVVNLVF